MLVKVGNIPTSAISNGGEAGADSGTISNTAAEEQRLQLRIEGDGYGSLVVADRTAGSVVRPEDSGGMNAGRRWANTSHPEN